MQDRDDKNGAIDHHDQTNRQNVDDRRVPKVYAEPAAISLIAAGGRTVPVTIAHAVVEVLLRGYEGFASLLPQQCKTIRRIEEIE